jgi:hypothetical protein
MENETGWSHSIHGRRVHIGFWWKYPKESDYQEGLDIDGMIILKRILRNRIGRCGLDSSGSGELSCVLF